MLAAIRQWVIRTMMKSKGETGIVKTIPKKDLVELNTQITAQRLMENGIAPNALKNANQVENAIISIENRPKVQQGIRNTESAKVFDMEGKEIPKGARIMGGKALTDSPLDDLKSIVDDFKPMEADIKKKLEKSNKKGIASIKNKMTELEKAIDNASPGFAGDRKYDAQLVADDLAEKRFGKDFYDLDQKQQMDLYDEAYQGLTKKKFDPPEDMAEGGRIGFAGGSTALKAILNFFAKESGKKGSQGLKSINPKSVDSSILNIMGPEHTKLIQKNRKEYLENLLDVIKSDKKLLDEIKVKYPEDIQPMIYKMANEGGNRGRLDVYKNIDINEAITDVETMVKNMEIASGRKLNSDGGRAGFKKGSDMTRRSFLKILGGLAAVPIVGKFFKLAKVGQTVKKVPVIQTDNIAGKPEWFDALVNKVILEGDDVTKKFATGERQIVHSKNLEDGTTVRVTQDTDQGAVRVEYESEQNVFGDPVQMEYKKPLPDEGDPRPSAEFSTAESGPVGRQQSPDDYDIEIDEVGGSSIEDLSSDVSKLKEYATGKGPTIREIVQNKKRKDKARRITEDPEARMDDVIRRQGEMLDDQDFASGGIARMLGE